MGAKAEIKWSLWVNLFAAVVFASFVAAVLVADVWIFPNLNALRPPPESVAMAIRQGDDIGGLRDLALILYNHVTEQAATFNQLLNSTVFWARLHFLAALGLACFNLVMLLRMRRSLPVTD